MELFDRKSRTLPISIREATPEDLSFIFSSWLKSFRSGLICKHVDNTIYFSEHHKVIERLLKRSTTVMACDPNDPATIYGYLCFDRVEGILVVHYAYVKQTFRGMGVLRQLLKSIEGHDWNGAGLFSHSTLISSRLSLKYNLVYHPYILLNYNNQPEQVTEVAVTEESGSHE